MSNTLKMEILRRILWTPILNNIRCAGHSKWQNIKHTKEAKDKERAQLFLQLRNKMRIAILEGGNTNPSLNTKLQQVIEQCRRASMPVASINSFLEKERSKQRSSNIEFINVVGPGSCIMIVYFNTRNSPDTRVHLAYKIKTLSVKIADSATIAMFDRKGVVITDTNFNTDKALEDALNIGAEDVVEFMDEDKKYFKFSCDAYQLPMIETKLTHLNYLVLKVEDISVPRFVVKLSKDDLDLAMTIQDKILQLEGVCKVINNIDQCQPRNENDI